MMIKAILLDMDNTLLVNPDRVFAKAFLTEFDRHMLETLQLEQVSKGFRQAIQQMSKSRDGSETNTALTLRILGNHTQLEDARIQSALETFYSEKYPELRSCVSPIDGASEFIHRLVQQDYMVVIATNPLYPETAIKQRMRWANLPTDNTLYALVTNADNMHFAKPDPAYFAEILARIGTEPDEAIVVGDSQRNDIQPAQTSGIHTYHIDDNHTLLDFVQDFDAVIANATAVKLQPAMIEPQIRGNIAALFGILQTASATRGTEKDRLYIREAVSRLIVPGKNYHLPQLQAILQEENPFMTTLKPDEIPIEIRDDTLISLAHEYKDIQLKIIEILQSLSVTQWQYTVQHNVSGRIPLARMMYIMLQQDRMLLNQLQQHISQR